MLRAAIFDFDGVISDTEPMHLRAFNKVLAQYGIEITETGYYKDYLGLTDYECFKTLAKANNLSFNDKDIKGLMEQKAGIFEELAETDSNIIEGAAEFLSMLKQNAIPMAICSGAMRSDIDIILKGTGLPGFFEAIVTADDVTESKPDPAGFKMALQRLNENQSEKILPSECLVVEDSPWGLEAATRAGMHTLAVTTSYTADELKTAEKVTANLSEVTIAELRELCA